MPAKTNNSIKNQRRKPKQQRALMKYEAVLDACTQVLLEYGYEKSTVLELSLVSEVAVPTIYQYFPNKEAIFIAWYERTIDKVFQQVTLTARSLSSGGDLRASIFMVIRVALAAAQSSRTSLRKLLLDLPDLLLSHVITTTESRTVDMVMQMVRDYLGRDPDAETQARFRVLVRAMQGYVIMRSLQETEQGDVEFEANELTQLVFPYLGSLVSH